jgi:hypothetical protein
MADTTMVSKSWSVGSGNEADRERNTSHSEDSLANLESSVRKITDELAELLIKKHRDYGPKNISASPGGPLNGLRVRLHDKLARLVNLTDKASEPQYESVEDTLMDMANYAIIGLLVLRGKWDS